jgi:ribosomal protein L17
MKSKLKTTVKKGRHLREEFSELIEEAKQREEEKQFLVLPSG